MQKVGYQGVVDKVSAFYTKFLAQLCCVFQKKDVIQHPRFTKLIIADLMKKFPSITQRFDEDYHSIKDDISLVRTHKTTPRAHRTPTLTTASPHGNKRKKVSRETSSPQKLLKVTIRQKKQSTTLIPPPGDDKERDEMAEATLLMQEKLEEEEIEKMVKGEEDEESYASEFANSMFNDDDDDSDDKKDEDEEKDDDVEKTNDADEEKDNDDHTDYTLELTATVSPTTATTSKSKRKRGFTSNKTKILPGSIAGMCRRRGQIRNHIKTNFVTHEFFMGKIREVLDHCNSVMPELTFAKTNEMIKEEIPRLVHLAVTKDRDVTTLNLYPLKSSLTADLQHQLYLKMKSKPQDQAADPEL
ncbi:hypothetical protein Tco_0851826 [Tanacetum coccineum]